MFLAFSVSNSENPSIVAVYVLSKHTLPCYIFAVPISTMVKVWLQK